MYGEVAEWLKAHAWKVCKYPFIFNGLRKNVVKIAINRS